MSIVLNIMNAVASRTHIPVIFDPLLTTLGWQNHWKLRSPNFPGREKSITINYNVKAIAYVSAVQEGQNLFTSWSNATDMIAAFEPISTPLFTHRPETQTREKGKGKGVNCTGFI